MNSECEAVSERLREAAEGSLDGRESDRVGRHLDACPSCRSAFEAECRLVRDLAALPKPRCPDGVVDSIMRGTRRAAGIDRRKNLRIRLWSLKPAFAVALAIALAIGVMEWTRPPRRRGPVYSEAEVRLAGAALQWSLVLAAETVRRAEKQALETAFAVPPAGANSGGNGK
jgi:predicted anti-sigma-YlaC factor YlaD